MEGYSPDLIIGVSHVKESVDDVRDLLWSRLSEGTKVGIEPYQWPVPNTYGNRHYSEFFNAVGKYVESASGVVVPLDTAEAYDAESYRHAFIPEIMTASVAVVKRLSVHADLMRVFADKKEIGNKHLTDNVFEYIFHRRMPHAFSIPFRDMAMVDSARRLEPQIIVIGAGHVPPMAYEFPKAKLEFVLNGMR